MTSLKNAGDSQFFREDDVAQLVDRFFFFVALRVFEFLNAIEDLAKIAGRIDGELVTDAQPAVFAPARCRARSIRLPDRACRI